MSASSSSVYIGSKALSEPNSRSGMIKSSWSVCQEEPTQWQCSTCSITRWTPTLIARCSTRCRCSTLMKGLSTISLKKKDFKLKLVSLNSSQLKAALIFAFSLFNVLSLTLRLSRSLNSRLPLLNYLQDLPKLKLILISMRIQNCCRISQITNHSKSSSINCSLSMSSLLNSLTSWRVFQFVAPLAKI